MDLQDTHDATLRDIVGPKGVVAPEAAAPYLTEWRDRWQGKSPLILEPADTQTLSAILTYTYANDIPVVPQGGNTGLVGGQVPHGEVLISTRRMKAIRDLSPDDFTITVEAGVTLADVQNAAETADRLFPLSIGSEGSCQIGGNLSSNAGGVNVVRYGNMRDLTLGLEAVLPDGRVWHGLNHLRKNNTGYDLKHLFIGAEGTLGVITAAVLKLYPRPADRLTAYLSVPTAQAAVELLGLAQASSGGSVSSFELMNAATVDLVLEHFPTLPRPVETATPYAVLLELTAGRRGQLQDIAEDIFEKALERGLVVDGTLASSQTQANQLWAIRHNASEAMKKDPTYCVKCDVSVPIRRVPKFLEEAQTAVDMHVSGTRIIAFGHLGDGNIHYDILGPINTDDAKWRKIAPSLERVVHDVVAANEGSISAEHGIGQLKRDELVLRKSPVEMAMMQSIKNSLDPKGLMNPGKLLKA